MLLFGTVCFVTWLIVLLGVRFATSMLVLELTLRNASGLDGSWLQWVLSPEQVKLVPHSQIQTLGDGFERTYAAVCHTQWIASWSLRTSSCLFIVSQFQRAVHVMRTTPGVNKLPNDSQCYWENLGVPLNLCSTNVGLDRSSAHLFVKVKRGIFLGDNRLEVSRRDPVLLLLSSCQLAWQVKSTCSTPLRRPRPPKRGVRQAHKSWMIRLRRTAQPHACGFVTAVPSGKETATSLSWITLCASSSSIYGDHATCCAKKGVVMIWHFAIWSIVLAQTLRSLVTDFYIFVHTHTHTHTHTPIHINSYWPRVAIPKQTQLAWDQRRERKSTFWICEVWLSTVNRYENLMNVYINNKFQPSLCAG